VHRLAETRRVGGRRDDVDAAREGERDEETPVRAGGDTRRRDERFGARDVHDDRRRCVPSNARRGQREQQEQSGGRGAISCARC